LLFDLARERSRISFLRVLNFSGILENVIVPHFSMLILGYFAKVISLKQVFPKCNRQHQLRHLQHALTMLPPAVNDIPTNQKRRAFSPHEIQKIGIKANTKVSKAANKPVINPNGFLPTLLPTFLTTPPAADRRFPTTITIEPTSTLSPRC